LDDKVTSLENTLKTDQYNLEKAKNYAIDPETKCCGALTVQVS
jgi:hypothetical protein